MERRSPRQRKLSSSTPQQSNYYAGARFETIPTLTSLPAPPMRWTSSPLLRSQSSPSSPITTDMMGTGSGRPATTSTTVFKSASFPGDSSLMNLFGAWESTSVQVEPVKLAMRSSPVQVEDIDLIQMLIQASPKKQEEEKKRDLNPVKLIARSIAKSCHLSVMGPEYKDVTQHLKSLLKVSA